jgi:hypothetical protein
MFAVPERRAAAADLPIPSPVMHVCLHADWSRGGQVDFLRDDEYEAANHWKALIQPGPLAGNNANFLDES